MNFLYPEHVAGLNRRKIERDRVFILKEKMLAPASGVSSLLDGLGAWMIAKGKDLHDRHSVSGQTRSSALLQDITKIFRAETQL
jgi:hypothetical protein